MSKNKSTSPQNGKKRPLLILLILLMFAGICAVAGYAYKEINQLKSQIVQKKKPEEDIQHEKIMPVYVDLETFTVSLKPENNDNDRILYIGLTLKVKDDSAKTLLEKYLPEIRSRLLMLFSQQTATEIAADVGKEKLVEEIKKVVSAPLIGQQKIMVTDVLFNAFILR